MRTLIIDRRSKLVLVARSPRQGKPFINPLFDVIAVVIAVISSSYPQNINHRRGYGAAVLTERERNNHESA